MEECDYQAVSTDESHSVKNDSVPWKYFTRQIVIASATWNLYFTAGLCIGTPTVLIPQLKKELTASVIDDEMISWLYSCFGFASIPWVMVVPALSNYVGRKVPYIISCVSMMAAFIILYYSVTPVHILISEVVQGFAHASNITITVLIVSEYTNPRYRGIFLTIKAASFFWGIWTANAIGTFSHWKYIALAGIIASIYSFVAISYPESPHWLAYKGEYDKSKSAYRWLHGVSDKSEELQSIIVAQMNERKRIGNKKTSLNWARFSETFTDRLFYQPMALSVLMGLQYHLSGKLVCTTYAVDIIKKITSDEKATYTGMLMLDGVTVIGMYVGSFTSKILKRRTLYMSSSSIGIAFLFLLALYLYLTKLNVIDENNIISLLLLMIYSVSISCGPMIMSTTIAGEIIPIRYQALCYSIHATFFSLLFTLLLKFAPTIFMGLGMHGTFLSCGIISGACTVFLYLYLPETKDRTLLDIEKYFKPRR